MYRTATISAYDVMTDVHLTMSVRTYTHNGTEIESRGFTCQATIPSTGEDDDETWARDALVGLLEAL